MCQHRCSTHLTAGIFAQIGFSGRPAVALVFSDTLDADQAIREAALQKRIGMLLTQHYPAYPWGIYVSYTQGIIGIMIAGVMPPGYAYRHTIPALEQLSGEVFDQTIRNIGGELLERFGLVRAKMQDNQLEAVLANRALRQAAMPEAKGHLAFAMEG